MLREKEDILMERAALSQFFFFFALQMGFNLMELTSLSQAR